MVFEMEAKILSIYSADVEIETYEPDNDNFCFELTVEVGVVGEDGSSNFSTRVCALRTIQNELQYNGIVSVEKSIILQEYRYEILKNYIDNVVFKANIYSPKSWSELARKLSDLGRWEFEGYNIKE